MKIRGNPLLKKLDRAIGIPAVWIAGLGPRRSRPEQIRRVGVLRTAAIGDTLLLSGVLRDLRRALPDGDVTLVTGELNQEAGQLAAGDNARVLPVSVRSPASSIILLRKQRFDLMIDTGQWPRLDALFATLSGARWSVGFRTRDQFRHYGYDTVVEHSDAVHETENFARLLRAAGFASGSPPSMARDRLPSPPAVAPQTVLFHPFSGGYRGEIKEWPLEHWRELGGRLVARGHRVVVTQLADRDETAAIVSGIGDGASPAGTRSLTDLAALITACAGVVSVNTGVMHLAALLGVPTLSLDGPTSPHRWGPIGPRVASVTPDVDGCGYINLGFEYAGQRTDCMEHISVARVESAFLTLLSSRA